MHGACMRDTSRSAAQANRAKAREKEAADAAAAREEDRLERNAEKARRQRMLLDDAREGEGEEEETHSIGISSGWHLVPSRMPKPRLSHSLCTLCAAFTRV